MRQKRGKGEHRDGARGRSVGAALDAMLSRGTSSAQAWYHRAMGTGSYRSTTPARSRKHRGGRS